MTEEKTTKTTYKCGACGETVQIIGEKADIPQCCEMPMKVESVEEMEPCKKAVGAEFARLEDEDTPCDDGRTGKI